MGARLVGVDNRTSIAVDKPILLVGRHAECDVQLDSRKISRLHCCIAELDDCLVIRDLGSTNGIRINGERMLEARLNPGDELAIGNFRYRVAWDEREHRSAAPPGRPVTANAVPTTALPSIDAPVAIEEDEGSRS